LLKSRVGRGPTITSISANINIKSEIKITTKKLTLEFDKISDDDIALFTLGLYLHDNMKPYLLGGHLHAPYGTYFLYKATSGEIIPWLMRDLNLNEEEIKYISSVLCKDDFKVKLSLPVLLHHAERRFYEIGDKEGILAKFLTEFNEQLKKLSNKDNYIALSLLSMVIDKIASAVYGFIEEDALNAIEKVSGNLEFTRKRIRVNPFTRSLIYEKNVNKDENTVVKEINEKICALTKELSDMYTKMSERTYEPAADVPLNLHCKFCAALGLATLLQAKYLSNVKSLDSISVEVSEKEIDKKKKKREYIVEEEEVVELFRKLIEEAKISWLVVDLSPFDKILERSITLRQLASIQTFLEDLSTYISRIIREKTEKIIFGEKNTPQLMKICIRSFIPLIRTHGIVIAILPESVSNEIKREGLINDILNVIKKEKEKEIDENIIWQLRNILSAHMRISVEDIVVKDTNTEENIKRLLTESIRKALENALKGKTLVLSENLQNINNLSSIQEFCHLCGVNPVSEKGSPRVYRYGMESVQIRLCDACEWILSQETIPLIVQRFLITKDAPKEINDIRISLEPPEDPHKIAITCRTPARGLVKYSMDKDLREKIFTDIIVRILRRNGDKILMTVIKSISWFMDELQNVVIVRIKANRDVLHNSWDWSEDDIYVPLVNKNIFENVKNEGENVLMELVKAVHERAFRLLRDLEHALQSYDETLGEIKELKKEIKSVISDLVRKFRSVTFSKIDIHKETSWFMLAGDSFCSHIFDYKYGIKDLFKKPFIYRDITFESLESGKNLKLIIENANYSYEFVTKLLDLVNALRVFIRITSSPIKDEESDTSGCMKKVLAMLNIPLCIFMYSFLKADKWKDFCKEANFINHPARILSRYDSLNVLYEKIKEHSNKHLKDSSVLIIGGPEDFVILAPAIKAWDVLNAIVSAIDEWGLENVGSCVLWDKILGQRLPAINISIYLMKHDYPLYRILSHSATVTRYIHEEVKGPIRVFLSDVRGGFDPGIVDDHFLPMWMFSILFKCVDSLDKESLNHLHSALSKTDIKHAKDSLHFTIHRLVLLERLKRPSDVSALLDGFARIGVSKRAFYAFHFLLNLRKYCMGG